MLSLQSSQNFLSHLSPTVSHAAADGKTLKCPRSAPNLSNLNYVRKTRAEVKAFYRPSESIMALSKTYPYQKEIVALATDDISSNSATCGNIFYRIVDSHASLHKPARLSSSKLDWGPELLKDQIKVRIIKPIAFAFVSAVSAVLIIALVGWWTF